jgi:predicted RNA-binding protein with RPS1 domain
MNKEQEYMSGYIDKISVSYINFDNKESSGLLEIHQDVRVKLLKYSKKKRIELSIFKIETIDNYDYDDEKSVVAKFFV